MKTIKLLAVSIFLTSIFSVAAMAQTPPGLKVAVIDSGAFYLQKTGIKKLEAEYKKLDVEFQPDRNALSALQKKAGDLQKEIQTAVANKNIPVDEKSIRAKQAELEKMSKEFNFKKDDYETRLKRREAELLQPVLADIYKKVQAFSLSKGFDIVFDYNRLGRDGSVVYVKKSIDITTDFITFYNAQPAGTAAN